MIGVIPAPSPTPPARGLIDANSPTARTREDQQRLEKRNTADAKNDKITGDEYM
jgi:hypothetical protein